MKRRIPSFLRICLLSYRSDPFCGGQGVYIRYLSRALSALGHRVEVVSGPPPPVLENGIPLHLLPGLDLYNPADLFRTPKMFELTDPVNLAEWLGVSSQGFPEPFTFGIRAHKFLTSRRRAYDIVHDNQSLSYGVLAVSRRFPTVATIHHPITRDREIAVRSEKSLYRKWKQMRWYSFIGMQKRVAKRLHRIITVSETSKTDLEKAFSIPKDRIDVVPNGIDTDRFRPLPQIPRQPNRVIVTTSADTPLKGLGYLLNAMARMDRHVHLTVVGSPKSNGYVERKIRALSLGERVFFTGRIDDESLVRAYASAGVAVLPSIYEGFGFPAVEAMSCGVPVVSTTGGALPEIVGDTGLLVPPKDPAALAAAVMRLIREPETGAFLGKAGRRRALARFSWRAAAEKTVAAYREAIDAYHRP